MNPNQPLISSNRPVASPHSPVPVAPMVVPAPDTPESTSCCHFSNNFYLTAAFGFTLSIICVFQVRPVAKNERPFLDVFGTIRIIFGSFWATLGLCFFGFWAILRKNWFSSICLFIIQTVFLFVLGYILPTCFCSDFWRHLNVLSPNAKLIYSVLVIFLSIFTILGFICLRLVSILNACFLLVNFPIAPIGVQNENSQKGVYWWSQSKK